MASRRRVLGAVPNVLSLLRIALAAAFPLAPGTWRVAVVAGAAASDWLDGYAARRLGAGTTAGQILDAAADKLFAFSVLVTMVVSGLLAWWQMLLVIARDLSVLVVAGYVAVRREWSSFRRLVPRPAGRLTTGLQFALFVTVLLWPGSPAETVVLTATAAVSVAAAGDYLARFGAALRADGAVTFEPD